MRSVVALIPARGGSKGIPGKNLKPLGGKPLLQHTVEIAKASRLVSRVFLSTDSEEIASLGRSLGIEVPFLRPACDATDQSPMIDVVRHFLEWTETSGVAVDAVVLLQPTSPLRPPGIVDDVITRFFSTRVDSVVTTVRVPHRFLPSSLMKMAGEGNLEAFSGASVQPRRRQDKEILFARNGPSVLAFAPRVVASGSLYGNKIAGFEMSEEHSIDIDTPLDFWLAEKLIDRGHSGD